MKADDFDVLKESIDEKYISGNHAFDNHGEIALFIKEKVFDPLGGNKVTFTNYNDISTIMDNMKIAKLEDRETVNAKETETVADVLKEEYEKVISEETENSPEEKRAFSLTGDVTYTLYGKEYTESQSDMMFRVFAQVLKRHQDKVDTLPEQQGMNCAAKYESIMEPGTPAAKPSYFRCCQNFKFDNGSAVCIGTAYGSADKIKK